MKKLLITGVLAFALGLFASWAHTLITPKSELFPYSNDPLHSWACNAVYEYSDTTKDRGIDNKLGCYDFCLELSNYIIPKDNIVHDDAKIDGTYKLGNDDRYPTDLDISKYPAHLVNACAIVMHGAEW